MYFRRRRTVATEKDETPNYEVIRKVLVKQLHDLGVRKPELYIFSARFALEGFREGNARKIQSSGIRELQYHILETIRDRGLQLKVRTAAYVFIEYLDRTVNWLTTEKSRLAGERNTLETLRKSWDSRRAALDEVVEVGVTRVKNFFGDRIPNAESFAEREAVAATPGGKVAKEFFSIVVKATEIRSLAGQIASQVDEALMSVGEWFWEQTGVTPALPAMERDFDEGALRRLKVLASERAPENEDGTPHAVRGILELQYLLQQEFTRKANGIIEKTAGDIVKYFEENTGRIEHRMERIDEALTAFRSLRNEFHAHE